MKRIAIAVALFVLLIIAVGYNVWRANQEPVTTPASEVEIGRQKLHDQLEDSKRTEDKIEKQEWDSPALLQQVIVAHQQRIDKLKDNSQAGEIIAHDREAIGRLQKRIEELHAQAAAQPASGDGMAATEGGVPAGQPAASPPETTTPKPATPRPAAPKAAAPKSATPASASPRQ
jgi:hypothetical protein